MLSLAFSLPHLESRPAGFGAGQVADPTKFRPHLFHVPRSLLRGLPVRQKNTLRKGT
jgi:hypothetical protein